jgi:membrane protein DedA with SNARE-associated domain
MLRILESIDGARMSPRLANATAETCRAQSTPAGNAGLAPCAVDISAFYSFGLASVFAVVLLEQLGAPIPSAPLLIVASARGADDPMHGVHVLALAVLASTVGSLPWFYAGRRYGQRALALICQMTPSPGSCVRRTEDTFERYGTASLVVAKFVPGLAHLAAPLAGAQGIRLQKFIVCTSAGAALWAASAVMLGMIFKRQVEWLLDRMAQVGGILLILLIAAALVCLAWHLHRRQ